jgi:DNA invertase Pin-like site-specific DNA recombinase
MMLGIWFVFSKQYSDKLSEDISRGYQTKKEKGKAMGKMKYGYQINEDGYYEPHPKYFPLIKKAFEMKLYDNKSNSEIADWLNAH